MEGRKLPTILCVDDEPVGLMVRAKLLEYSGFFVITASDGPAAIEICRTSPVDLVLLDYMMPRMHGGEVARVLRAKHPNIPIILLSAYVSLPDDVTSLVDFCVVKGAPPQQLLATIHRILAARKHGKEAR